MRAAFLAGAAAAIAGCSSVSNVQLPSPHQHGPRWKTIYSADFAESTDSEVLTVNGEAWFDVECDGDVQTVGATLTNVGASSPIEHLGPAAGSTYAFLRGPVTISAAVLGDATCTVQLRVSPRATWSVAHGA